MRSARRTRVLAFAALAAAVASLEPAPAQAGTRLERCRTLDDRKLDPSCDPDWAPRQVGAFRAWAILEKKASVAGAPGTGVFIAQMDSGYTDHPELGNTGGHWDDGALLLYDRRDRRLPLKFKEAGDPKQSGCSASEEDGCAPADERARKDPRDPVSRFGFEPLNLLPVRQPGHGTKTASIIVSPRGRELESGEGGFGWVTGVAPGARILPFQVTGGSVLSEGRSTQMAEGIQAAALLGEPRVHVLTVSFGRRSPDPRLEAAVRLAEHRGVILVAAGGQTIASVTFPGQYGSVIAVAGTEVDGGPWRSGGRGPDALVAAPAVDVWRAGFDDHSEGYARAPSLERGQGTSFAAPLVASAAAIWLQRYGGWEKVRKHFGQPAVHAAFEYALRHHGHRSPEQLCILAQQEGWPNQAEVCRHAREAWDTEKFGRGILAIDLLIEADALPDPVAVCADVYRRRGAEDYDRICPEGSPGRADATTGLLEHPPLSQKAPRPTLLFGTSVGRPFGKGSPFGPAVTGAVVFSSFTKTAPRGLLLQGKWIGSNWSAGLGYATLIEYNGSKDAKDKSSILPGFGPGFGAGVKAAFLRSGGRNYLGIEAEIVALKLKLMAGRFWSLESSPSRWTLDAGVGF